MEKYATNLPGNYAAGGDSDHRRHDQGTADQIHAERHTWKSPRLSSAALVYLILPMGDTPKECYLHIISFTGFHAYINHRIRVSEPRGKRTGGKPGYSHLNY